MKCLCGEPESFCVCSAPHSSVTISRLPKCDFCWETGVIKAGVVTGWTKDRLTWGFFCAFHWGFEGVGRLGWDLGQRLVVERRNTLKINSDTPSGLLAK